MIQKGTMIRGVSCLIFLVTLISSSVARWEEVPSQDLLDLASLEIDQDTAELLLINCRRVLIIKELNLCFPRVSGSTSNSFSYECLSFSKGNIWEVIHALRPDLKQKVVDCLRRNGLTFRVSGVETVPKHWYSRYPEPVSSSLNTHRRFLAATSPAAAPGPAVSISPSPSPSGTLDSDSNVPTPPKVPFFPPFNALSPQALLSQENSSESQGSNDQVIKGNGNNKAVVIAVSVTASVTFLLAALLFICYNKFRSRVRAGRNDERPLLSLSMSDYAFGFAYKPYGLGGSIKEEKLKDNFPAKSSAGGGTKPYGLGGSIKEEKPKDNFPAKSSAGGSTKGRVHSSAGGIGSGIRTSLMWETFESPHPNNGNGVLSPFPLLKPPPGRVAANTNFLKPPPGRADPLPPEPPAPPKLSAKAGHHLPHPPPAQKLSPLSAVPTPSPGKPSSLLPAPGGPKQSAPPLPTPPALSGSKLGSPPAPSGPKLGASPPPPPPAPSAPQPGTAPSPPPPAPGGHKPGPPPPPPKSGPSSTRPPPHPPRAGPKIAPHPPLAPTGLGGGVALDEEADAPKMKLKPFFWDKVLANPDQSMVWHQIKSGSFQFNEETIETLFGYALPNRGMKENKKDSTLQTSAIPFVQIIDSKKAQNLLILLRALNMTIEEVRDALLEGNELPKEFLQSLLKMTPTADEELKLQLFSGELSELNPADRFLKTLVDIPSVFKRMEALLLMSTLQEEVTSTKESFETLEVACKQLRNSRLFLKLLEAVLKTGNRMNDGTFRGGAQAFRLNTLLKLSDVKGTDGKTTLLHFVVQEIVRSEGIRAARAAQESQNLTGVKSNNTLEDVPRESEEYHRNLGLQVISGLGRELGNVKKAAAIDVDTLTSSVAKLGHTLMKTRNFLNTDMKNLEKESGFHRTLKSFMQNAEIDVMQLLEEEKRIMGLVKSTGDYFHGKAGKDEGLRVFVIVRDFLIMLDKVCKEVKDAPPPRPVRQQKKVVGPSVTSPASDPRQPASFDLRQRLFPAIQERRMNDSSSDDES